MADIRSLFGITQQGYQNVADLFNEKIPNAAYQAAANTGEIAQRLANISTYGPISDNPNEARDAQGKMVVELLQNIAGRGPFALAAKGLTAGSAGGKLVQPTRDILDRSAAAGAAERPLFDYSRLSDVPNVKQFDLPRYDPPRGAPARTADLVANPAVREQMTNLIQSGAAEGKKWYNAEPLREAFVSELGNEGPAAFRRYMDFVAATSPRSKVGENVRNASYYYGLERRGEAMPEIGARNPAPYGHMAQRLHQQNAGNVAGAGWDPLTNPKPASFVENLAGNQMPATIDAHATKLPAMLSQDPRWLAGATKLEKDAPTVNPRALHASGDLSMEDALKRPVFWDAKPAKTEYAAMEKYYQDIAKDLNITPAQAQASAWLAGGKVTGLGSDSSLPFLGFLEQRVAKTAAERGISKEEALSQFIRAKAPLLSGAGLAAGGGVAGLFGDAQKPGL